MADESEISGTVDGVTIATAPAVDDYAATVERIREETFRAAVVASAMPPAAISFPLVCEFRNQCYARAAYAFRIAVGGRVRVTSGRSVPHGLYVVENHFWGTSCDSSYEACVSLRASVLKVTPKTPRFARVPVRWVEVVPDFSRAFDADGWRGVGGLLRLAGYFADAYARKDSPPWSVVADMVQEQWEYLEAESLAEPGARFAPLLPYGPDAVAQCFRTISGTIYGPPGANIEAVRYNLNPANRQDM